MSAPQFLFLISLHRYPAVYHLCTLHLIYTQLLTMDWRVRGLNPDGGEIFYISVHANTCKMYTRSFRETERPERGAEYTASSAEVEKGLELYLRFPSPSAYACREATLNFKLTY